MKKPSSAAPRLSVAEYLDRQITASPKRQVQIAEEIGYPKPNMISMIKRGVSPLPISKVGVMAKALDLDPAHLLRLAMQEYYPDTWKAIEEITGDRFVSEDELKIVWIVRSESMGNDVCPETDEEIAELKALVREWRDRRMGKEDIRRSKKRLTGRPSNAEREASEDAN